MNSRRYKIRMFLTTLFIGVGGILPSAACPGGCGACFQCAGLGGVMAIVAAIGTAKKKERREEEHDGAEAAP